MAWSKLADRLTQRPRLLAGPLLRRVTGDMVTVWVVTRTGANVTLSVKNNVGIEIMIGNRHTVAVGANFHIVAVTAFKKPVFTDLSEGIIYHYDLTFDFDGGPTNQSLAAVSHNFVFTYGSFASPTFVFPPKDLNNVRLMQGSCRMPHGSGPDNLFLLDVLIEQSAENPLTRPHHLLLTGDQIYADDVPDILLIMLSEASNALLGWQEILPVNKDHGGPKPAHNFSPYFRGKTLQDAGFTSDDVKSHLMSLGEYLAMYLFAWSEVCWAPELPTYEDVVENVKGNVDSRVFKHWKKFLESKEKGINNDIKDVTQFRQVLPKVRRALANIPSSMIFDDHEVTDDWNMVKSFCKNVYSDPLGKRIMTNGLVAYALCQHWGNVPEEFEDSALSPAGLKLLRLLDKGNATTYEQSEKQLQRLVSIHDWNTEQRFKPDFGAFHDQTTPISIRGKKLFADSLTYNYTVEMPAYQVIVTDTRSWRSFPRGDDATPDMIPKSQFNAQILDTPKLRDRLLLVVLTTNMPPVEAIRHATRHSTMSTTLGKSAHPDLYEAWELPSEPFDRLVVKLTDKLDRDSKGVLKGQIILLSGDVHHSYASRLMYRAKKRFEDAGTQPAAVVFAQLVASSLKKQDGDTVSMHDEGYKYGPTGAGWLVPKHAPEGYAGFLLPKGTNVGEYMVTEKIGLNPEVWLPLKLEQATVQFKGGTFDPDPKKVKLTKAPDYRYRLDYLNANVEGVPPQSLPKIPPLPTGTPEQRKKAAEVFNKATGNYRVYNRGTKIERQIVGFNNICEITFDWGAEKRVHHTIRWLKFHPAFFFTTVTVSLDPDDPDFGDITALKEP